MTCFSNRSRHTTYIKRHRNESNRLTTMSLEIVFLEIAVICKSYITAWLVKLMTLSRPYAFSSVLSLHHVVQSFCYTLTWFNTFIRFLLRMRAQMCR